MVAGEEEEVAMLVAMAEHPTEVAAPSGIQMMKIMNIITMGLRGKNINMRMMMVRLMMEKIMKFMVRLMMNMRIIMGAVWGVVEPSSGVAETLATARGTRLA